MRPRRAVQHGHRRPSKIYRDNRSSKSLIPRSATAATPFGGFGLRQRSLRLPSRRLRTERSYRYILRSTALAFWLNDRADHNSMRYFASETSIACGPRSVSKGNYIPNYTSGPVIRCPFHHQPYPSNTAIRNRPATAGTPRQSAPAWRQFAPASVS